MAATISALLDPARVALHLGATEGDSAIEEAAQLLNGHPDVTNFPALLADLRARAALETVCLSDEVALPHARSLHVRQIVLAVGRTRQAVTFAHGSESARLLFVIGTPKSCPGEYLQVVSALCRVLKNPASREALLAAESSEEFIQAIRHVEEQALALA